MKCSVSLSLSLLFWFFKKKTCRIPANKLDSQWWTISWRKQVPFSRREKSPTPWNTLLYSWPLHDMMGLGYGCTLGRASVLHMKVMKTVWWSTITVPPPENLLTTGILSCKTEPISRSSAGFLRKWIMLLCKITQFKTYSSEVLSLQLWHSSTHNFLH